jgi:hypothetical protein
VSRSGRERGRRAVPKHVRYALVERDGRNCAICGKDIGDIERANCDHIVPRAHGGKDKIENLQLSHFRCNLPNTRVAGGTARGGWLVTHYSRAWDCWVCSERQESVDLPKLQVCDVCLTPVARVLCKRELGVDLDAEGVDRGHWMRRADAVVHPMMRRRREPADA